jgi:peptide/nickel transport system permease protein
LRNRSFLQAHGMKILRNALLILLLAILAVSLFPGLVARASYHFQFREFPNAAPSRAFPLGTDEVGRDRLARLLYGTRLSLLLAPAAALLSLLVACVVGALAGYLGGWWDRLATRAIDLTLSLPWLFLLITARALLPLNVSPLASLLTTFTLLGLLGWASPARVIRAGVRALRDSDVVLQAKACGCANRRLLFIHILPRLKPVLIAQFCTAVPFFILSEANLSLLGVGVAEPMPSWGNLLRGLENQPSLGIGPLAPLILLVIVISSFQLVFPVEDYHS